MAMQTTASQDILMKAQADFDASARVLEERLSDADFLANRGLGNEVGFHVFCYDPAFELQARKLFKRLESMAEQGKLPCRIIHRNLYDIFIEICNNKRILAAIPKQEEKRGSESQVRQLQRVATPELFAQALDYEDHQSGDVLLISGVGEVYPFLRAHVLLDNIQHLFSDIPVVLAYPGKYDGQSFSLFSGVASRGLNDGNYYRAFNFV